MTLEKLPVPKVAPGSLGLSSGVGHGELPGDGGGLLGTLQRLDFIGQLLRNVPPKIPVVRRVADLPTASAAQERAIAVVSTGTAPDVLYVCLLTAVGPPAVYAWVDISTPYVPPAAPPEGVILVGSNNVESSPITSTSAVDAITVSGLSIPTGKYVSVDLEFRKTTGAAASMSVGFSVNAAAVQIPFAVTGATNAADSGLMQIRLGPREANYLVAGRFQWSSQTLAAGAASIGPTAMPAAVITSISIQALVSNAAISGFVKNVRVYTYP